MKKIALVLALASVISAAVVSVGTLAHAAPTDTFNSKLYQSCNERSVAAVTAAMVNGKGQSTDSFVSRYKGKPLDKRLATLALNALNSDFRDADSDRLVLLQNFLSGICYQATRS